MTVQGLPQASTTGEQPSSSHWIAFLLIGLVFFCTTHDLLCTRDYVNRAKGLFAPTDQPAIQLVLGWESGRETSGIAYGMLGALGLLGLFKRGQNRLRAGGWLGLTIVFFVCWASASLLWSGNPSGTAKHVFILLMMSLALTYAIRCFSDRDLMVLAAAVTAAYLIVGLCAELSLDAFQLRLKGYRFSGTNHPIATSVECATLCMAAIALRRGSRARAPLLALAGFALVCLVMTRSRTSFYGLLLAPMTFGALSLPRSNRAAVLLAVAATVCFLIVLGNVLRPIMQRAEQIGHADPHDHEPKKLEGRADLWGEVVSGYIAKKPFLGYGFNSFWTSINIEDVAKSTRFRMFTTRSAFVELFLGLGLVGMIAYVAMYLGGIHRSVVYYRATKNTAYFYFGTALVFALLHSTMESVFVFGSATTFMAMAILAKLGFQAPPDDYVASIERKRSTQRLQVPSARTPKPSRKTEPTISPG